MQVAGFVFLRYFQNERGYSKQCFMDLNLAGLDQVKSDAKTENYEKTILSATKSLI